MIDMIRAGDIRHGTVVWRQGLANWTKVEETELASHYFEAVLPEQFDLEDPVGDQCAHLRQDRIR